MSIGLRSLAVGFIALLASLSLGNLAFADTTGSLLPTADGNYTQWTASPAGSHYVNVDDSSCNGNTDYNETLTTGNRDSYVVTDSVPNGAQITQIAIQPCASKTAPGPDSTMKVFYRFGGINSVDSNAYSLTNTTPADQSTSTFAGLSLLKTSTTTLEIGAVHASGIKGSRLSRIVAVVTYTPLTAPSGATATASTTDPQILVTWTDNSSIETNFEVLKSTDGINFSHLATTSANAISFTDLGLAAATTYYYEVRAYNFGAYSAVSNSASATTGDIPVSPSNVTAVASTTATIIELGWSDNSNNESSFVIERSTTSTTTGFSFLKTVGSNTVTTSDTSISSSTIYYYRVSATNGYGTSSPSTAATAIAADNLAASLIHYWKLDESSGDAADAVGSLTLTNNNSVAFATSTGKINNGVSLDSSSSQYFSGTLASSATANLTVALWVYIPVSSMHGAFFHNGSHVPGGDGYTLGVGDTTFDDPGNHLILLLDNVAWINSGASIGTGWHHVAITRGASTWKFYVDGTAVGTTSTISPSTPTADFALGRDTSPGGTRYPNAYLDEVGFWARELSASEVSQLYNGGAGVQYPFLAENPPAAPSNTVATASATDVQVTWTDNSSNESSFEVLRSTDGTSYFHTATTSENVTSYTDIGLASSTTYYYEVRAFNSAGYSSVSNVASTTTGTIDLTSNLIHYWKLDDSSGDATDSVGSLTLTNNGSIAFATSTSKINNGVSLDGSSQYFSGGLASSATTNVTIALWVYIPSSSTHGAFLHNGSNVPGGNGYTLGVGNGDFDTAGNNLILLLDSAAWIDSGATIGTGWHHVAVTRDATTWKFYIDGSAAGTTSTASPLTPTSDFQLGRDTSNRYFGGDLDEVGFWTRALSASEISQLYNSGAGVQYPF
jgi:hypothetical protein